MIGDTIATADLSAGTGDLPDHTSHITTFTKVNQDAYSSEYRYRGTDYDYVLKIRNTVESPRADGLTFERHNVELQVTKREDPSENIRAVPYITSFTVRMPRGGSMPVMKAVAGHLLSRLGPYDSGATLTKILNFES